MHFSTFSAGFALLTCRFDSLLWKIIPVLLDSGNKVEFFRLTQTSFFVRRKNSTLFPSSSKSGIIFHSALSNLQVRNAKRTEKVEKCISLELLFFLTERQTLLHSRISHIQIKGAVKWIWNGGQSYSQAWIWLPTHIQNQWIRIALVYSKWHSIASMEEA